MQPIQILVGLSLLAVINAAHTNCGWSPRAPNLANERIVGGQNATLGAWPWLVALADNMSPVCGGSIIASKWILSAAHCFPDKEVGYDPLRDILYVEPPEPLNWTVITGDRDLFDHDDNTKSTQYIPVDKIFRHTSWKGQVTDYGDIALLKLAYAISYDSKVQPICLPKTSDKFFEDEPMCWAAGWGETFGRSESTAVQQQVHSEIIDIHMCNLKYDHDNDGRGPLHTAAQLCFGDGRKGTCMGDSGGPLMCKRGRGKDGRWILAGATSWGNSKCEDQPGVFTKVSHYRDWIDEIMEANP